MLAINLFVLPVACAGMLQFAGQAVDADTFVLSLPLAHQQTHLTLLVFIGGMSAATKSVDRKLGGLITDLVEAGDIGGKPGTTNRHRHAAADPHRHADRDRHLYPLAHPLHRPKRRRTASRRRP